LLKFIVISVSQIPCQPGRYVKKSLKFKIERHFDI
jgi:hypothetical protein